MAEDAPADDVVVWRMELKQEKFADRDCPEIARAARLPEIDLVGPFLAEQLEPAAIGDGDIETDHDL